MVFTTVMMATKIFFLDLYVAHVGTSFFVYPQLFVRGVDDAVELGGFCAASDDFYLGCSFDVVQALFPLVAGYDAPNGFVVELCTFAHEGDCCGAVRRCYVVP